MSNKIAQDLWRMKDYASDLLVLKLASLETVTAVLSLPLCHDPNSVQALCVTLLFMRTHLFAAKSVGVVDTKTIGVML